MTGKTFDEARSDALIVTCARRIADDWLCDGGPNAHPDATAGMSDELLDEMRTLARAVLLLDDARLHYEGALTWHTSCLKCSTLLDRCYQQDRHLDEAHGALAAALVDAAKWRRCVAANGSETEVWARSRPEPLPPGTTIADALRWPDGLPQPEEGAQAQRCEHPPKYIRPVIERTEGSRPAAATWCSRCGALGWPGEWEEPHP